MFLHAFQPVIHSRRGSPHSRLRLSGWHQEDKISSCKGQVSIVCTLQAMQVSLGCLQDEHELRIYLAHIYLAGIHVQWGRIDQALRTWKTSSLSQLTETLHLKIQNKQIKQKQMSKQNTHAHTHWTFTFLVSGSSISSIMNVVCASQTPQQQLSRHFPNCSRISPILLVGN